MYKSITDWCVQLKKDISTLYIDGLIMNRSPELLLIQFANLLLLTCFLYLITKLASDNFTWFANYFSNFFPSVIFLLVVWQSVIGLFKGLDIKFIERFSIVEIFKFDLRPSYFIYIFFILLNFLGVAIIKVIPLFYGTNGTKRDSK